MDESLAALAAAHGVAVSYENGDREQVEVDPDVVVAVLAQLGVDPGDPPVAPGAGVPTVVRQGVRVDVGTGVVLLEDGGEVPVSGVLPADLPLGWHRLRVGERETSLAVTPAALPPAPRTWGWMTQLYALHTPDSWGVGDYADLRSFVAAAAAGDAGAVLVSPVAAPSLVHPVQRSPYSPSSRRFLNPIHLSVTETDAFRAASADVREQVRALRPDNPELVDHDAVWRAKSAALELLFAPADPVEADPGLLDYATFAALAEEHGEDWREWPEPLREPGSAEVAAERARLSARVAFHVWVQGLCSRQLEQVHAAASGMAVGVVHDLPVGVTPSGADAWSLRDVLATSVTVGAPPDAFSPLGQDWVLPPFRPDRLAEAGYLPFRDMIRAVLRHGDGIRVDHVAGLWRLWWIPPGETADRGTYVHYDAEAMLGVLLLEAHRAGAVVIGEDLGTVPDEVTDTLRARGVLSCSVAWFERDVDGRPRPPADWPAQAAASVSTHDLPTALGFLTGDHVRVRADLGLLSDPAAEELRAADERAEIVGLLESEGLVAPGASAEEVVDALHVLLARTPCALVFAAPADLIGEARQPNLPGTVDQYPNWRIPLPLPVADIFTHPTVRRAVAEFKKR
ncbi:4-alpha-glucanotransferase (amylomaltase) [Actinokineospora spheciospongiae]|uniref:4-alpha-glucanotransferase n=1 Tax=Actinokineospora spheciospongiae TaxID=909613 RepID=W7ISK4_9PSEU|nr:4-alpha-glucanotransferase [Actinokineospora spheciospongiae]EWC63910.1 4-alpha-glucanotransferase (amylomaltase) [Actinokineospora spheciospongiae]